MRRNHEPLPARPTPFRPLLAVAEIARNLPRCRTSGNFNHLTLKALRSKPCAVLAVLLLFVVPALAQKSRSTSGRTPEDGAIHRGPVLESNTARPLRYWPQGTDFVITNGPEFFNRPLYCLNSAFRIDGGDKPEFSLYLPGRGGNLRLGVQTATGAKWLNDARQIITRYRPGSLLYALQDPLLGDGELDLTLVPLATTKGCILQITWTGPAPLPLICAFGGANGLRGSRDGDIGCEREPVSQFFQLQAAQCADNFFTLTANSFTLTHKATRLGGVLPVGAELALADARHWSSPADLLASITATPELPVLTARFPVPPGSPVYLALQTLSAAAPAPGPDYPAAKPLTETAETNSAALSAADLPQQFAAAEARRQSIAERVTVETPDPFINAAAAALCIAGDAVWDEKLQSYMHGAVAWRTRLLGWRGAYTGDALGWHDRTAAHFAGFAKQQNTQPIPAEIPPADEDSNLARNETALHSNGDLTKAHYDMNLAGVDAFFRHLLWTGDLTYARQMWPVIERHLAWERRLFRRAYGPDHLPLYEAYCCIWASDNMQYNGGGVTHATAYNYWHNKMAARVAHLLNVDATPYEQEAGLIARAMQQNLWLADRGWFAEFKDYLGLQLPHPSAGLWTFYHTVDSDAASPFEAWQMSRFVDTQIAHIPLHGPNVPDEGFFTLPESNWMPYMWSLNNVVMAEVAHTSLGYWEARRPDVAFRTFKGCLLDSMYLGLCPGNLGCMTDFDVARGEAQRDFDDACGITSRALVEGLFGLHPDALAGELKITPGWPAEWDHATIKHPDVTLAFQRAGLTETYSVTERFPRPLALRLQIPSLTEQIARVTVNGQPADWQSVPDSIGQPRIEITQPAGTEFKVEVQWAGTTLTAATIKARAALGFAEQGATFAADFAPAQLLAVSDPQGALSQVATTATGLHGLATGTVGARTVFAHLRQAQLDWWQPVSLEIRPATPPPAAFDWQTALAPDAKFESINLAPVFNDQVAQIFQNEYRSPRSPFCSLALPKQGIGGWCDINTEFTVNDAGLRAQAAQNGGIFRLPDGIPLATPGEPGAKNIAYTSQWDNYPRSVTVPLTGQSAHAFLLMAGSANPMQSQFDNAEVIVTYEDGSTARLALRNPVNWWPIDQDYLIDDYGFRRPEPIPPRVDLKTGRVRLLDPVTFKGQGGKVPGGAATVLDLPLDPAKTLKSLTLHTLANEVVIGLMAVTLQR